MSSRSEQERERLKEEYKEHYRKIRDMKEKLRRSESVKNISNAVENMNTDHLMDTVDHFLAKIRHQVAHFEARLDVAMENVTGSDEAEKDLNDAEMEEILRKEKARETLKQVKIEMGMLYNELEKRAGDIHIEKTVGTKKTSEKPDSPDEPQNQE